LIEAKQIERPKMRDSSGQPRRYRFGSFDLELTEGELRRQGTRVKLNDKPFRLLCMLLERAGHLVTREDLRQRLWSADTYVDFDANLNTALSTLRHTLGDSSDSPLFIETVPRQGYRFIAPVTVIEERGEDSVVESKTQSAGWITLPIESEWRRFRLAKMLLAVAAFFVVTAAVSWVAFRYRLGSPEHSKLMILVTPFENLSGDPGQEYMSDGLTDEMITRLGQISPSRLSVIARSTAMQYKHTEKSLDQIVRECRPDYIFEGSLRRQEGRVRITAQLFKAGEQGSLWTQAYDQDAKDVLIIQQDVADRIARSLSLEVLPAVARTSAATSTRDADAYDAYLKGLFELNKRAQPDLRRSITYFQAAAAKDPSFAAAYAALAASYNVGAGWNFLSPADSYPIAKAAAQKALSLDDNLPDAHAAYAEVLHDYDWDWSEAEREYRRALDLNPSSASGHKAYAEYLTHAGRYTEALAEIRRAQSLDPGSLVMSALVCYVYYHAREYGKAISQCDKVLELDSGFVPAHYWRGASYVFSKRYDEAIADFGAASDSSENPGYFQTWAALAYALGGRKAEARTALKQLQLNAKRQYVSPYGLASVHLALGDREMALTLLEDACQQRAADTVFLATAEEFDSLHNEPRFRRMISLIEFPRSAAPYAEAQNFRIK
jgi:TolB-like protein/DNA-binding winged helix-turn-helix (wHTH) protein/predicted Zn-dependent protease